MPYPMQSTVLVMLLATYPVAWCLNCSEFNKTHNGVLAPLFGWKIQVDTASGQKLVISVCSPIGMFSSSLADAAAALIPISQSGDLGVQVILGQAQTAQLFVGTGWLLLVYTGGDSYSDLPCTGQRSARIVMECNPGAYAPILDFIGEVRNESNRCHHLFGLQHYTLCGLVPDPSSSGVNLTPVAIVIVSILALFCAYLAIGMLIQRFYFGRRGAAQIPNYTAWQRFGNAAASCCDLVCRSEPRPSRNRFADAVNDQDSASGAGVTTHHLYADLDDDHLLPA